MTDIKSIRRYLNMDCGMCCSSSNASGFRTFLTKEEKIGMLKEYKEYLDKESLGVAERIAYLEKDE